LLLRADERLPRSPTARILETVTGRVEFRHVNFGYNPRRIVLSDVSFVSEPGQFIGVVGASGSGKSTLAGLIPRSTGRTSANSSSDRFARKSLS